MSQNGGKSFRKHRRRGKPQVDPDDRVRNQVSTGNVFRSPHNSNRQPPLTDPWLASSSLTDDPLWSLSDRFEDEMSFIFKPPPHEFNIDARGFMSLIEEEYYKISIADRLFPRYLSLSAYAYFSQMLLWYHSALHATRNCVEDWPERGLMRVIESKEVHVPVGLATYFKGLGNFTGQSGMQYRLVTKSPNTKGHFGVITHLTHDLYESLPAPAIAIQRVLEDIKHSHRKRDPVWGIDDIMPKGIEFRVRQSPSKSRESMDDWEPYVEFPGCAPKNLKEEKPEPEYAGRPLVNLLGWQKSRVLLDNQVCPLERLFPDKIPEKYTDLSFNIPNYCFHYNLYNFVLTRVHAIKNYRLEVLPKNHEGSLVQAMVKPPYPDHGVQASPDEGREKEYYSELHKYVIRSLSNKGICGKEHYRSFNSNIVFH